MPADIDPSALTIDATSVAERVTERTSAIIATHLRHPGRHAA
ncbi:MAG: DegT/DnrJ/EryC1/StrS family aminotransferase [Chloroflexota bacterium]